MTIAFEDFLKVELKVATILEADLHPNADRLFVLKLDLGEEETRQICAGIRGHYELEQLVGRQIIVVANLAPRKIRGEESNGMLLAAGDETGEERKVFLPKGVFFVLYEKETHIYYRPQQDNQLLLGEL